MPQPPRAAVFAPLAGEAGPTLVQQIEQALLHAIVEGRLALGARMIEAEYARQLGVSRAPLREAARLLESRGLLVAEPGRGFSVRRYTPSELDDIYGLRICLERFALAAAVRLADPADLARLTAQRARLQLAAEAGVRHRIVAEDIRLHRTLCAISGNARLCRAFDDLAVDLQVLVSRLSELALDPRIVARSHDAWLAALLAGDGAAAEAALVAHIGEAWTEMRGRGPDRLAAA